MLGFAPESINNSNIRFSDLPLKNQQESSIVVFIYSTGLPAGMTGTLASGPVTSSLNDFFLLGNDMTAAATRVIQNSGGWMVVDASVWF